ncbi:MAG: FAD-binding protein [Spirochaetaceae bacterium]|nr:MAG: FAD-binding protein [Spirochaetaceae bacterium]
MHYTHDLIIIGGGAGGLTTAAGCAQLGLKTALIEREHMGGDCLHFGCVPSKTLIHTAGLFAAAAETRAYGNTAYTAPVVDMQAVNARISAVIGAIAHHDSPERFRSLGAEVFLSAARFRNDHELEVDGQVISAKHIVIATGSRAAVPPVPGLAEAGYLTNRDVFSLPKLPSSLVVLGAGPIGVELGQCFTRLGSKVTLVDMAPRILPRDDAELAEVVATRLRSEGITIIPGAKVEHVSTKGGMKQLSLSGPNGQQLLEAEQILVAAGCTANTGELQLEAAGIEAGRGGYIAVNNKLQSSQSHIYVVGDANGAFPFTHVAGAEGALAVRRIALHAGGKMDYRTVPWVSYTEPELAAIGHSEDSAHAAGISARVVRQSFAGVDRAHAEAATEGLMKIVLDTKDRVIGVQIAATGAGELLPTAVAAVRGRRKFKELSLGMLPYPTMNEVYGKAVSAERSPLLFNPRVRSVLRTLFRYRGTGPTTEVNHE